MTMYALEDTTFLNDLVADCGRNVKVRVILDQNLEKSGNTSAYNKLNATTNCSAVWANKAFQATHQKTFTIDGTQTAIMSLNLQSQYYSTTRDFALVTNDDADIAAIQATFNMDYAAGTPSSGVAGTSDFSYTPPTGTDLIWSPTTAQSAMLAIINNATTSLVVENEEMGASNIVNALEAACTRGVTVHIAMVSQSSYATNFKALENAGCGVHVYPDTATGFYIHAKAVVADYGLSSQSVYMGSINYSNASMTENRELGLYISDAASVQSLYTTMAADYAGGTAY
jgi:phosphatidylserine/phosphatidylglycerophosphate/cardiolipin synthase-like enzyme